MSIAVGYAFCCLFFAALNDFVFKLFARKERSRGLFVAVAGSVWFALLAFLPWSPESDFGATLLWGAVSGALSVTSNLLLIEAMSHNSAGMCATIFRLNLVLVVLSAALLLDETLTLLQWCGVLLAALAVLAFLPAGGDAKKLRNAGLILVLAAAALRSGMGIAYKYGFTQGADRNGIILINSIFWIVCGGFYALFSEKAAFRPERKVLRYGLLSGFLLAGIVVFMALSLEQGSASVVLPVAQMSFLGTFLLSALLLKEKLSLCKAAALLSGSAAIILLTVGG